MSKKVIIIFFSIILVTLVNGDENIINWEKLLLGKIEVDYIKSQEQLPGTRMLFILRAPRETIWSILLDDQKGAAIHKDIERAFLISENRFTAVVEYWIDVGVGKYHYILERTIDHSAYHIEWSRLSGDFKRIEGSWTLLPTPEEGVTLMIYETFVETGYPVPLFIQKWVAKTKVKDLAKSLRRYFEKG